MKKILFGAIFCLIFLLGNLKAQNIPEYSIPSYNVVVDGLAVFLQENQSLCNSRQKKSIIIHLKSSSSEYLNCQATIWVCTVDRSTVLGPFTVNCDETLTVPIDDRDWEVLVYSEDNVIVDIWINEDALKKSD